MTEAAPAPSSGGMVLRRSVVIPNSRGLHARAAAKLVALAERYSACVNVLRDGQSVPAVSIMGLMMLGAAMGTSISPLTTNTCAAKSKTSTFRSPPSRKP